MKLKEIIMKDMCIRLPILQGGMGVGVSLSNLAGNVSRLGAFGCLSAAHIGFNESDFSKNPLEANMKGLKYHIEKAKEIACGNPVAINIMCAIKSYESFVKKSAECGVDMIVSGAGLPIELPAMLEGFKTKIAPIVSSAKAASVIFKMWDRRYKRCADLVVIEGPKAGGHLGFSLEDLNEDNFEREIQGILSVVKEYGDKYGIEIPVVFAGGVFEKSDINHFLDMGLSGVQMASRFVATNECDASIEFKNAYINAKKEDITIIKSPVGMPGRAIKNNFTEKILNGRIPVTKCQNCIINCDPKTTAFCITEALIKSVKGDTENGLVFAGSEVYRINKILALKELMTELTEEVFA